MGIIRKFIWLTLFFIVFSCNEDEPEIHRLKFDEGGIPDYFIYHYVIKNPPKDSIQVIKLVEEFVKYNVDFDLDKLKNVENFGLIFYKEGLTVDRNSGPNTTGRGIPFLMFWREKYYTDVMVVEFGYDAKEFVKNKKARKATMPRNIKFGKGFN